MPSFFQQPFPSFYPSRHSVMQCGLAGISVFFVLFLLQPFGMDNYTTPTRLGVALAYGGITFFISILFTCLLPVGFPALFDEKKWTVAKELIFFVVLTMAIAVGNFFFSRWMDNTPLQISSLLRIVFVTFCVAFVPVFISVFIKQHKLFRKYKNESEELNNLLNQFQLTPKDIDLPAATIQLPIPETATTVETQPGTGLLELTGENQQEKLSLHPDDLMLVSAADNYVRIHYTGKEKMQQAVLRGSLKNIEGQLNLYVQFLRCHRSYIVNLQKVTGISGNAQGYKLEISGLGDPVPVGRNYNLLIKEKLQHLRG
jgi:DNA-binding LytR/AlgR family response regulator